MKMDFFFSHKAIIQKHVTFFQLEIITFLLRFQNNFKPPKWAAI